MKTVIIQEKEKIESILADCKLCFAGIADKEGKPYVIPMNFGYKEGVIYLHSGPQGKSIDILKNNNQICIAFSTQPELVHQHPDVACSYRIKAQSIICQGHVTFIEDPEEKRTILNFIMQHYAQRNFEYGDAAVKNVKVWKVPVEEISAKEYGVSHNQI